MRYLLDTHIFIWWVENNKKLTADVRAEINNPQNEVLLSMVSAWEMSVKLRKGKLKLKTTWEDCFRHLEFNTLNITFSHVAEFHKLPLLHKDPFDRMLIAQARVEGATLITLDPKLRKYKVPILE